MAKNRLTSKQIKFCNHYIKHRNATKAAEVAGYKGDKKQLSVIGNENLKKVSIKEYVEKRIEKIDKKQILSLQEVLEEITSIALEKETTSSRDRLKALELLGKTHAAFTDKIESTNKNINKYETMSDEELEKELKQYD